MAMEQFQRAKDIFLEASERPEEERAKWVEAACGSDEGLRRDVESMLALNDREDSMFDSSRDVSVAPLECPTPRPERIGEFRILDVLGEGGMGVVYLAEQEKPQRNVALKVIRPGIASPTMLQRFEYEAQVLAQLHHPGIAQVFAVDKTDMGHGPQPFFAMEHIEGLSLTEYADTNKLSTSERLQLVAKICDAVQHAHQKGVIHRDLKPGNILVEASGQPKILDFGVARATDSDIQQTTLRTNIGELIGTIPYMSPEQAVGDPHALDTRSDVYALGMITYELLTGRLPYQIEGRAIMEMLRIIREDDQTPLSSISRVFRGDIETIVSKALEKDRSRRYQSASDLAADIEHYLRDEPITARPPSAAYQLRKFVRRNRALVAGVAAVFLTLVIGAVGTSVGLVRAKKAESNAVDEAAKKSVFSEFLTGMLTARDPRRRDGQQVGVVDMLDLASQEVDTAFADQPEIKASVHQTIGETYFNLGQFDSAEPHFTAALKIHRRVSGEEGRNTLTSMASMGALRLKQGKYSEAEPLLRQALNARQRLLGEDHPDTLASMHSLASFFLRSGKLHEAELLFRDSLALTRRRYGEDHLKVIQTMNGLAGSLFMQGKFSEAGPMFRRAIELGHRILRDDHPDVTQPTSNLAAVLAQQGKLSEAEAVYRPLLDVLRRVLTDQHPDTLVCMGNLAGVLQAQGKLALAEPILRQVLENTQRLRGDKHPNTLKLMNNLAALLGDQGKFHEAEPLYRETLETRRHVLREEHPSTIVSMSNLAFILLQQGNISEAEPLFRTSLEAQRRALGDKHPLTLTLLNNLALLLMERGALSEAEALCRQALETRREILGMEHSSTLLSMHNLATLLRKQDKTKEAEQLYRRTLDVRRRALRDEHVDTLISMNGLADLLSEEEKLAEAESLFVEVMQIAPQVLAPDHWQVAVFHSCFGSCLTKLGRYNEAETHLLKGYQRLKTVFGEDHHRTRETIARLAVLYEAWAKPEKAAKHRAMLSQQTHQP